MKGFALDKEFMIGILMVTLVLIVALLFFMGIIGKSTETTDSTQKMSAECAKWISESTPCGAQEQDKSGTKYEKIPDKYPSLVKAYNSVADPSKANIDSEKAALMQARAFCNCPN
jgi:hypothetical protein